jgi:hypothetical protein
MAGWGHDQGRGLSNLTTGGEFTIRLAVAEPAARGVPGADLTSAPRALETRTLESGVPCSASCALGARS